MTTDNMEETTQRRPEEETDEERLRREEEEAIERILLAQEAQEIMVGQEDELPEDGNLEVPAAFVPPEAVAGGGLNNNDHHHHHHHDNLMLQHQHHHHGVVEDEHSYKPWSYTQISLGAALGLIFYALRSREQWYLALVYMGSSKLAYIVLGNAVVALCVATFRRTTQLFVGDLRLREAEELGEFFRWNVTETCLALTMFRKDLTVQTGLMFVILVLFKCLHWIADLREAHLRVTQEAIQVSGNGGGGGGAGDNNAIFANAPRLDKSYCKLWCFLVVLLLADCWAVQLCTKDIIVKGMSVTVVFLFEAAILLVSGCNSLFLWHLHVFDGLLHYIHDHTNESHSMHRWIHPWKEYKATFVFAVQVQAHLARFVFYVIFFGIVLTMNGMPINLLREVYKSFHALRQKLLAFDKYRRLMASMNRFEDATEEDLENWGRDCIICRDSMTVADCKKLPGCGHIFHKSCLREWLVQQQTCPTCRSDIAAMEEAAERQRQRDAAAAAAAERETEESAAQENEPVDHEREATQKERAKLPPTQEMVVPSNTMTTTTKRLETKIPSQVANLFPALYRVVLEEGAQVWSIKNVPQEVAAMTEDPLLDEEQTTVVVPVRVIPLGILVVCHELEFQSNLGFVFRIPDGVVKEDALVRIQNLSPTKGRKPSSQPRMTNTTLPSLQEQQQQVVAE